MVDFNSAMMNPLVLWANTRSGKPLPSERHTPGLTKWGDAWKISQPFILAICSTLSWNRRSDASCIGGIVKLLFELSVHLHEPATFLSEYCALFSHVAYAVAVGVAVEFGFAVGVVVVPIQAVRHHFLLDCPSSSPVINTANTIITRERKSVIRNLLRIQLVVPFSISIFNFS